MSHIHLSELRRWVVCAAVVVLAHAGLAAGMVTWQEPAEGTGPAAGIVIELAPVPVAPATLQSELPPAPQEELAESPASTAVDSPKESDEDRADRRGQGPTEGRGKDRDQTAGGAAAPGSACA